MMSGSIKSFFTTIPSMTMILLAFSLATVIEFWSFFTTLPSLFGIISME
ncbi:hypothetical protein A2U01_0039121 [Trifolium medium]|uniref:Uncharacterized protein n=1 Tax=Trifolium medium TaxID=97028 RepID=A0A392Q2M7_9FABA|nr:hypothetical protein [Trifolium medium]